MSQLCVSGSFFLLTSHCAVKTICQKRKSLYIAPFFPLSFCILSNTDVLRHSSPPALSQKHLNCMLCERGRDTQTKVKWPKRRIHVSPDEIGNYTLHTRGPELVGIGPLRSNHRLGNVEISLLFFFPRSKRTACVRVAHKHTVCVRGKCYQGNVWNSEFSICGF